MGSKSDARDFCSSFWGFGLSGSVLIKSLQILEDRSQVWDGSRYAVTNGKLRAQFSIYFWHQYASSVCFRASYHFEPFRSKA